MSDNNKNEYQDKPFVTIIHDGDKIDTLAQLKRKAFNIADMAFRMHSYSEINLAPAGFKSRRRVFKFDHIVIKTKTRSEFNYDLFDESKFIDVTYVTNYPENCIVLVDASKGLNTDFYWYLKNRIDLLLALVNLNYDKYNDIENCAAFRDLMSVLCFINKYSDKFVIGSTVGKFILIRCYDIPGIYFKVIPTVAYTPEVAPKPTMIVDNPRYNDSEKETKKFNGAFVTDPDFKPSKIKDLDIATLYPTKKDPVDFNPTELLRKLALEYANHDFDKKQLDWLGQVNKETVKRAVRGKKTDVKKEEPATMVISSDKSTVLFNEMTDEQIANNYEDILKFFINGFNKFINGGMDIKEAWKTNVGKDLISFINYIFDLSTKDKFGKSINFAIVVDDDYNLRLGKYSDIESADGRFGLTSPGNFIRSTHTEDEEEGTDSDQQQ